MYGGIFYVMHKYILIDFVGEMCYNITYRYRIPICVRVKGKYYG